MRFNIITIFPKIFNALDDGVAAKSIKVDIYNLREKALNKHGQIDAKPYGGGEGMVLMPEPLKDTLLRIPKKNKGKVESTWVFGVYNLYNRDNAASIIFRRNNETLKNEAVQISIFGIVPSVTYNFKF